MNDVAAAWRGIKERQNIGAAYSRKQQRNGVTTQHEHDVAWQQRQLLHAVEIKRRKHLNENVAIKQRNASRCAALLRTRVLLLRLARCRSPPSAARLARWRGARASAICAFKCTNVNAHARINHARKRITTARVIAPLKRISNALISSHHIALAHHVFSSCFLARRVLKASQT